MYVLAYERRYLSPYAVVDTVNGILRRLAGGLRLPVDVVVEHHCVFRTVNELKHVVSILRQVGQGHVVEDMALLLVGNDDLGKGLAMGLLTV